MEILKIEKDLAEKWRVLVDVADGINQTFKFDHNPEISEIQFQVDLYLSSKIKESLSSSEIENKINDLLFSAEFLKQQLKNEQF